jgi:hypothetical protein
MGWRKLPTSIHKLRQPINFIETFGSGRVLLSVMEQDWV